MAASSFGASEGSVSPRPSPLDVGHIVKCEAIGDGDNGVSTVETEGDAWDDEDREFEALRAEFTARAITEACRTKIRSLLPGYCSRRRFLRGGQPKVLPGLNYFVGGPGEVSPRPACTLEGDAVSPTAGRSDAAAAARDGGSRASADGCSGGGSIISGCESDAAHELPDLSQVPVLRSWLPASIMSSAGMVTPAVTNGSLGATRSALLPEWRAAAATAPTSPPFAAHFKEEKIHRCSECQATFTRSSTLKRHLKLHRGIKDRPFKCTECSASFAYNNHLKTHMRIHTGERPFACDICGATFARSDGLKIHRRKHTGERPYSCAHCAARFSVAHHLKEHVRTHFVGGGGSGDTASASADGTSSTAAAAASFMCRECGDELPSMSQLRRHMASHTAPRQPSVPSEAAPLTASASLAATADRPSTELVPGNMAASRRTGTSDLLDASVRGSRADSWAHRRSGVANGLVSWQQPTPRAPPVGTDTVRDGVPSFPVKIECPSTAAAQQQQQQQQVLQPSLPAPHPKQQPPLLPPPLSASLSAPLAVSAPEQPAQLCHEGPNGSMATPSRKPFKCELCPFSFQCRAHLATHMRIHTGERPYACAECGASFARPDGLKIHRRTHTGERPYACGRCEARFSMAHHLRQHARRHTGEKPFMCTECGDDFSTANRLKQHRRVHTGEKPFECTVCKARFTWSDYLRVHMRTHTGERPYSCGDCGAAFARSDILKVHRRTHTGERPYACRDCPAAFKTLGQLQSHGRTHHGYQASVAGATDGAADTNDKAGVAGADAAPAAMAATGEAPDGRAAVPVRFGASVYPAAPSRQGAVELAGCSAAEAVPSEDTDDDRPTDMDEAESMSCSISSCATSDAGDLLSDSDGM